ncbi:hypothetical protein ACFW04_014406 [Cataglyphis niger]
MRIAPEHRAQRDLLSWTPQESHATLGLHWHPNGDCFSFSTRFLTVAAYTKRSVLSLTARLFDPLGWLAPTVIRTKVMFQSTWLRGVAWDTPLDEADAQQWSMFQRDLPRLEEIRVERRVPVCDANAKVELLVSRTHPKPRTSLHRSVTRLRQALGAEDVPIHLWSDSTVALGWIRGHLSRWTVYVANHVAEIQTALPGAHWHHLPGKENPADCASRGISPSELVDHLLWWRGPPWLSEDRTSWPSSREDQPTGSMPEERVNVHAVAAPVPEVTEPEELLLAQSPGASDRLVSAMEARTCDPASAARRSKPAPGQGHSVGFRM